MNCYGGLSNTKLALVLVALGIDCQLVRRWISGEMGWGCEAQYSNNAVRMLCQVHLAFKLGVGIKSRQS